MGTFRLNEANSREYSLSSGAKANFDAWVLQTFSKCKTISSAISVQCSFLEVKVDRLLSHFQSESLHTFDHNTQSS